jgi:hypothetical protein
MAYLKKSKKALYALLAMGIIGFATYGVYNTVLAFNDTHQSQTSGTMLVSDSSGLDRSMVPGGTFCNPYGCSGCTGCVSLQYQQNVDVLPSSGAQVEESY